MAKLEVINVEMELFFVPETCNCTNCFVCDDLIVSDNYRLHIYFTLPWMNELEETDIIVCESCKNIIEEEHVNNSK